MVCGFSASLHLDAPLHSVGWAGIQATLTVSADTGAAGGHRPCRASRLVYQMVPRTQSSRAEPATPGFYALTQMMLDWTTLRRSVHFTLGLLALALSSQLAQAVEPSGAGQSSGLPVPRFV